MPAARSGTCLVTVGSHPADNWVSRCPGRRNHPAPERMEPPVRRVTICSLLACMSAALLAAAPATADPAVVVYPGMEVIQDTNACTLGYVDPNLRVAFTAGHCRGSGPVTDTNGNVIGNMAAFRDNTPNGATVRTDQVI